MKPVWAWIKGVGRWLLEPWRIWLTIGLLVLVLSPLPVSLDDRVRYGGLLFELLGIGTVAYGLSDKSRLFNRQGILDECRGWWSRRPRWEVTHHYLLTGDSLTVGVSGSGDLSFWHGTSAEASVETRVAVLEKNLEILKKQSRGTVNRLKEEIKTRNEALNCERQTREQAIGDIRTLLETFGAGGLNMERIGISWLLLGVIFASIPSEVARGLRWLFQPE